MSGNTPTRVRRRVARVAEDVLAEAKAVSAVDVLVGLGWLATSNVDRWRQGRAPYLTIGLSVPETKAAEALAYLPVWARERGLEPSEVEYAARTRDRRPLRFSEARDPEVERASRTGCRRTCPPSSSSASPTRRASRQIWS